MAVTFDRPNHTDIAPLVIIIIGAACAMTGDHFHWSATTRIADSLITGGFGIYRVMGLSAKASGDLNLNTGGKAE